jgi:hypothetical protein
LAQLYIDVFKSKVPKVIGSLILFSRLQLTLPRRRHLFRRFPSNNIFPNIPPARFNKATKYIYYGVPCRSTGATPTDHMYSRVPYPETDPQALEEFACAAQWINE